MGSEEMAPYEDQFVALEDELTTFIAHKKDSEARWSWVASGRIALAPLLGALTAVLVVADVPAGIGAASAIVTGLSSLVTGLPDDRKRVGNKVLAAKAQDLFERVVDREEELRLEQITPYELLRRFRYERSILNATSSTAAAVQPFWELPSHGPDARG